MSDDTHYSGRPAATEEEVSIAQRGRASDAHTVMGGLFEATGQLKKNTFLTDRNGMVNDRWQPLYVSVRSELAARTGQDAIEHMEQNRPLVPQMKPDPENEGQLIPDPNDLHPLPADENRRLLNALPRRTVYEMIDRDPEFAAAVIKAGPSLRAKGRLNT